MKVLELTVTCHRAAADVSHYKASPTPPRHRHARAVRKLSKDSSQVCCRYAAGMRNRDGGKQTPRASSFATSQPSSISSGAAPSVAPALRTACRGEGGEGIASTDPTAVDAPTVARTSTGAQSSNSSSIDRSPTARARSPSGPPDRNWASAASAWKPSRTLWGVKTHSGPARSARLSGRHAGPAPSTHRNTISLQCWDASPPPLPPPPPRPAPYINKTTAVSGGVPE